MNIKRIDFEVDTQVLVLPLEERIKQLELQIEQQRLQIDEIINELKSRFNMLYW